MAAKRTADLIPLCHPLFLSGVDVTAEVVDSGVELTAIVKTTDRTGCGDGGADRCPVAPGGDRHDQGHRSCAVITDVRVLAKSGGRSGDWRRLEETRSGDRDGAGDHDLDAGSGRVYADTSGLIIVDGLRDLGFEVNEPLVVPDGDDGRGAALRRGCGARGDHYWWYGSPSERSHA